MSHVDCAVQLRHPDHGESSGVVNQLLALEKPVVCMRTGSFIELKGAVTFVETSVSAKQLAGAIERVVRSGWPETARRVVASRSPSALEHQIRQLMGLGLDRG
jgi:hypothetical protein